MKSFLSRFPLSWACYLAYFVGVSFQSGGIVHYSLDPGRYGKLIVIGAFIFVVGAISSDLVSDDSRLRESGPAGFAIFIVSSLVLSIGVGLIGGSVQHFNDIPRRAPLFIGLGVVLSALGYHGRFRPHRTKVEFAAAMGIVCALAIPVTVALRAHASGIKDEAGHVHGSETPVNSKGITTLQTTLDHHDDHADQQHDEADQQHDEQAPTVPVAVESSTTISPITAVATSTAPSTVLVAPPTAAKHDSETHKH
jgi:hypothetical protein